MSFKNQKIQVVVSNFEIGAGKRGASKGPLSLLESLKQLEIEFDSPILLNQIPLFVNIFLKLKRHPIY